MKDQLEKVGGCEQICILQNQKTTHFLYFNIEDERSKGSSLTVTQQSGFFGYPDCCVPPDFRLTKVKKQYLSVYQ